MTEPAPLEPPYGAGPMPDDPSQADVSQDPVPEYDPEVIDQ